MESKEVPDYLSAKYKGSFAYITIKDRLPVILTKTIDSVYRLKNKVKEENGEDASAELKDIAGALSKLRHQIQTDKAVEPLHDDLPDVHTWNQCIQRLVDANQGKPLKWFSQPWLFLECYMYRRIAEGVNLTSHLKNFDVYEEQKQNAYMSSDAPITTLLTYLQVVVGSVSGYSPDQKRDTLKQFMKVALWGNKCDLSLSLDNHQKECILDQIKHLQPRILLDNSDNLLDLLHQGQGEGHSGRIDIVLDNAGFELITDLCLAEYLVSAGFAKVIHLHGKAIPWFVSDVTQQDLDWTLLTLCSTNNLAVSSFGAKWREYLSSGTWIFHNDNFWTSPYEFCLMKKYACDLYNDLAKADLIFFKGDLNYRKLVGDRRWDATEDFSTSLQGFQPAPLCALRALKADVVTGLRSEQVQQVCEQDKDWMTNGSWAVIAFHAPKDT